MLELQGITEDQLTDILFTEFPDDMTLEESRELLELEIVMLAQEMADTETNPEVKKLYDTDYEDSFVAISPMWIDCALRHYHATSPNPRADEFKRRFNYTSKQ